MGYGYNKSETETMNFTAGAYFQAVSLLDYVANLPDDADSPITPEEASKLKHAVMKYTTIDKNDLANVTNDTTVRIHLFPSEALRLERVYGYALAGGFYPKWRFPETDTEGYVDMLVEKCNDYFYGPPAARTAKEIAMLNRIRYYVNECNKNGTHPVKARLVDDENSYSFVTKVWKIFDAENAKTESTTTEETENKD